MLFGRSVTSRDYSSLQCNGECETLVGSDLPQLEVRVVGGGDLRRKATQVSVVNGVSRRKIRLESRKEPQNISNTTPLDNRTFIFLF